MDEGGVETKRTIKLFCPSLSKSIHTIAREEQKLDLGSISRAFGLDPATLKLNGHFLSRGVDLIASSVTWKSLLSFFSARGMSTGTDDSDALIVDGKLIKVGSKRVHDPADAGNRMLNTEEDSYYIINKKSQLEDSRVLNNKRFKESKSGTVHTTKQAAGSNASGVKRKFWLEDAYQLKRTRSDEPVSDERQHLSNHNKLQFFMQFYD